MSQWNTDDNVSADFACFLTGVPGYSELLNAAFIFKIAIMSRSW